jgi:hypothetical protein
LKAAVGALPMTRNKFGVWARLSKSLKAEFEVSEKNGQLKLQADV